MDAPDSPVATAAAQFGRSTDGIGSTPRTRARCPVRPAAALKAAPHRLYDDGFTALPERLRTALARPIGADPQRFVLGNSTSHGRHLIVNGLGWTEGDDILVLAGDRPATVLAWQRLAR
ncbi:hypothetical protein [Amycolatopsis sp. NPDC051903]|uniref:hypothetical protein n=1 Tax=Amycolatopsis sp. NPDC051903 TaxID=3363936 RepID=UPI00379D8ED4